MHKKLNDWLSGEASSWTTNLRKRMVSELVGITRDAKPSREPSNQYFQVFPKTRETEKFCSKLWIFLNFLHFLKKIKCFRILEGKFCNFEKFWSFEKKSILSVQSRLETEPVTFFYRIRFLQNSWKGTGSGLPTPHPCHQNTHFIPNTHFNLNTHSTPNTHFSPKTHLTPENVVNNFCHKGCIKCYKWCEIHFKSYYDRFSTFSTLVDLWFCFLSIYKHF